MKIELADITTNERHKLNGFKILWFFPFYLSAITVKTHVKLCKIKEQIQKLKQGSEPTVSDFYDSKLQESLLPFLINYCVVALLNDRFFSFVIRIFLKRKIYQCTHNQILNLYLTIQKLNEPAFFLTYWKWLNQKDNTILSEVKQS